jgi:hypothetical protein
VSAWTQNGIRQETNFMVRKIPWEVRKQVYSVDKENSPYSKVPNCNQFHPPTTSKRISLHSIANLSSHSLTLSKLFLPYTMPNQNPVLNCILPCPCYMSSQSHTPTFHSLNITIVPVQITQSLIMQYHKPPTSCIPPTHKYVNGHWFHTSDTDTRMSQY